MQKHYDWKRAKGVMEYPLPERAHIRLRLSGSDEYTITATDEDGIETVLQHVVPKTAFAVPKWSDVIEGYTSLKVKPSNNKNEYGMQCQITARQTSEPLDDELPPPPAEKSNLLAKMRDEFRRSLGDTRERFDNDTLFPGYEIDDDEPDFEPIERPSSPAAAADSGNESAPDENSAAEQAPDPEISSDPSSA